MSDVFVCASKLTFRARLGGGDGCEDLDLGDDVVVEYRVLSSGRYTQLDVLQYSGELATTVFFLKTFY